MVFLSVNLLNKAFWRKRKIFKFAGHFLSRRRNCYRITISAVQRSLWHASYGRGLKKLVFRELWENRIDSAAQQHGLSYPLLTEGLDRCNILLNRKTLADLAIWEPRTFKSLTDIACARVKQDGIRGTNGLDVPPNVITKGPIE